MKVKISYKGNTLIAGIIGELDHHTAEYVREKIDSELIKATTKNVIFDFSKVTFMDSSGIGVIMGRFKNVSKLSGKLSVANVNPQLMRIFEMSGLLKVIPVYDNIDAAIKNM
ncbi:MAG TPA: anti-sigma F factor antagonist [Acetivibrio clariflavus]|nr:anti-sigma F factor antagonist [Acetivibrio clariflavus]HPU42119.1 anti-sigma F factor antagonist [Acetivibrio clariflavus]